MQESAINEAFEVLPFIIKIKDIIMDNLSGSTILQLSVSKDLYDLILENNSNVIEKFGITSHIDNLLYITMLVSKGLLTFGLKQHNEDYELKFSLADAPKKTSITLYKTFNMYKVETVEEVIKNDVTLDYNYDVYYYDNEYNLLSVDNELEKDEHFSKEFGVPLSEARLYRKNFKKHYKFLSDCKSTSIMKFADENLEYEKYEFRIPFSLNEFELFMTKESIREISKYDNTFEDDCEIYDIENFDEEKLKAILEPLKAQIGIDGCIIMSSNLYNNINFYLLDLASAIYTNGFIIKKIDNQFILYYVNIEANKIVTIPQQINQDDLELIFNKNPENENVPGLKEFFGFGRDR